MKYAKLIFRNAFRKKLRAFITAFLVAFIFAFIATLLSILHAFDNYANAGEGYNRLAVQSAASLADTLPYSHEQKIRRIPGVIDTCKLQWIGGVYKDPKNFFANFAIDHDKMLIVFPDYKVDPKQFADFQNDRQGALVGPELMKRFGWKIGDRITLKGPLWGYDPELVIRGTYEHAVNKSALYYHMDYHQEMIEVARGTVATFWLSVKDPGRMAQISEEIDALFRNSAHPTETFTEKEFQKNFMSMMGNIQQLFTVIGVCSIFMVVLLAAITMSMSARERVTEIAVLKAIGFTRGKVLALMLFEFVIVTLAGGAAGGFGAKVFFIFIDLAKATQGFLTAFSVPASAVAFCLAVSVVVGLIAGGWPALRATGMSVVDGLRRVV